MTELLVVLGLALLATPVMAFAALLRTSSLRSEIEQLQQQVSRLSRRVGHLAEQVRRGGGVDSPEAVDEPVVEESPPVREMVRPRPAALTTAPPVEEPPQATTEQPATEGAQPEPDEGPGPEADEEPSVVPLPDAVQAGTEAEAEPQDVVATPETPPSAPEEVEVPATSASGAAPTTTPDLETVIGTTWVLRIGLGVLAIALALFARAVAPQLPPAAKVGVAYLGAGLLFGVGRLYEDKLERFARPVMAAGLTFGFFVAFSAHFVSAMETVPLSVSLVWMLASMATVLVAAERWQSEGTAALAIVLGHVAGFVAIGQADAYSLAIIAVLAMTSAMLVLRHRWFSFGIAAVVLAYTTHFAWILAGSAAPDGERSFLVNLAFLTSYYAVFLIADVLWWRRHRSAPEEADPEPGVSPRYLGPANLVFYVSLASFVYVTTGAQVESIEWFYVSLGALQAPLAWLYRDAHHRDYVFYPAFGTILWTLGMFAGFDALTLNLVLAAQALLLLIAAHRTRLWVFHALAQVALLVAFVHYWTFGKPQPSTWPLFLGGMGLVAVYFVKASLEELWYAGGSRPEWLGTDTSGKSRGLGERTFDRVFAPLAPMLAPVHAAIGGFVLVRESHAHFGWGGQLSTFVTFSALALVGMVLARRRTALLFALSLMAAACLPLVMGRMEAVPDPAAWWPDEWSALVLILGLALAAVSLAAGASRRLEETRLGEAFSHGQVVLALALGAGAIASFPLTLAFPLDAVWLAIPFAALAFQEFVPEPPARETGNESTAAGDDADPALGSLSASTIISLAAALLMLRLVTAGVGIVANGLVWTAALSCVLFGWSWLRRSESAGLAAYTLLMVGYTFFLLAPDVVSQLAASPWSGIWVTAVPIAAAMAMDALRADQDGDTRLDGRDFATLGAYALALTVLSGFSALHLPVGWWEFSVALFALVLLSGRLPLPLAMPAAAWGLVGLHAWFAIAEVGTSGATEALLPLILFGTATLSAQRLVRGLEDRKPGPKFADSVGFVMTIAAIGTMMAAIYVSTLFGPPWATAGWALLGGALMGAGFALRYSLYRRTALVVFAISLARVFLVDTRGLSSTAKTGVFFVLGLILVGVGWLYSRYADRIKEWL